MASSILKSSILKSATALHDVSQRSSEEIISSSRRAVVKISAEWCKPCQRLGVKWKKFANKYPDIAFVEIDIDECEEKGKYRGVKLPTTRFYKSGKLEDWVVGEDVDGVIDEMLETFG